MIAAISAPILLFVGERVRIGSGIVDADDDAELLIIRAENFGQILAGAAISGLGIALLAAPLYFLFAAARGRSPKPLARLGPLVVLGAPMFGLNFVLTAFAYDGIASDFFARDLPGAEDRVRQLLAGAGQDPLGIERAEELITDSTFLQLSGGVGLAGVFALAIGGVYAGLHAMRTGLLTRFWGTLGMAFSVAFGLLFILGPVGLFGMIIWLAYVGLLANDRWFGRRPPAWDAGVAKPWPGPGESKPAKPDVDEEPASPEDFGVTPEPEENGGRPARRDRRRKRKRKQRRR